MDKPYIKTSSIELATTLFTLGNPIDGIHYSGIGDKMDFYFADTPQLRELIQKYHDKKLLVEPSALFWSRREILSRMYNEKNTKKPSETEDQG